MPDAVVNALINAGILGPIVLAIGFYVLKLHRERKDLLDRLAEAQEKRTQDAKAVVERIIEIVEKRNDVDRQTISALVQMTATLEALKEAVKDLTRMQQMGGGAQ